MNKSIPVRHASSLVLALNVFAVVSAGIMSRYPGTDPFSENGFITIFSGLQLLIISCIVFQIKKHSPCTKTPTIWAIITIGFIFLAADEIFRIHENLDWLIHDAFNLQETGLTDRIDDILIGLYGLVGIGVLLAHFDELRPYRKAFPFFLVGFIFLFTMVGLDVLTNRNDILPLMFSYDKALVLQKDLAKVEESLKIFAEAFFVVAFYRILQMAKKIIALPQSKGFSGNYNDHYIHD